MQRSPGRQSVSIASGSSRVHTCTLDTAPSSHSTSTFDASYPSALPFSCGRDGCVRSCSMHAMPRNVSADLPFGLHTAEISPRSPVAARS
eukprot:2496976-Pleurochrysis_carterae.AAC.2